MKTNAININTGKSHTASFHGLPQDVFLRNLKGNKCACCGNEMIPQNKISDVIAKLSLPLKDTFTNGKMSVVEKNYPTIWNVLQDFAQKYPKDSLGKILYADNNYTVFIKAIADAYDNIANYRIFKGFNRFENIKHFSEDIKGWSSAIMKPNAEIMKGISVFKKFMRGYRKDIFEELEYLAYKYPDKHLSETLREREVFEGYIMATLTDVTDIAKKRDLHIANADKIIMKKDNSVQDELKTIHTQIYEHYKHLSDDKEFLYKVKKLYQNLLESHGLKSLEKKVFNELEQLPVCLYTKNTFFSHARRYYTDIEILNYILKPLAETEEHIIPYGVSHDDSIGNKITMCRDCNVGRRNIPYTEFLKYHPEMIKNTNHQLNFIAKKIIDGKIPPEMIDYPVKAAHTLSVYTDGAISPDLSEYVKNLSKIDINYELR